MIYAHNQTRASMGHLILYPQPVRINAPNRKDYQPTSCLLDYTRWATYTTICHKEIKERTIMLGIKAQVQENGPIERENNEQALWHHVAWGNWSAILKLLVERKKSMTRDKLEIWNKMKELFLLYSLHLRESCAIVITPEPSPCWFEQHSHLWEHCRHARPPSRTDRAPLRSPWHTTECRRSDSHWTYL